MDGKRQPYAMLASITDYCLRPQVLIPSSE